MASPRGQMNVLLPLPVLERIDALACQMGISRNVMIRHALGLFRMVEEGRAKGYHAGLTRNPEALEIVIAPPF